jgi:hypothetical protein
MIRLLILPVALAGSVCVVHADLTPADVATRLETATLLRFGEDQREGFAYGDASGRLHLLQMQDGKLSPILAVAVSGSPILGLAAQDLEGDGETEVVAYTRDAELFIYGAKNLERMWRSPEDLFSSITALAVAQLDDDAALEIALAADGVLVVLDGFTRFEEWRSAEQVDATDLLVADVDGDEELEIVTSSGVVVSAGFFQIEWRSPDPLGWRLAPFDLDGDGVPEVIAETREGALRLFDLRQRQEIW